MNTAGNSTLVVVPTYNERENVAEVIDRLLGNNPGVDVLIVDDNSPDGTQAVVERLMAKSGKIHLLRRPGKSGLGTAYVAGFQWGLERGYARLVQMDADLSHDPRDVARFIEGLKESDVVIGCRYMEGGGTGDWPWGRRLISRGGNIYAQLVLGLRYLDLTGGFNAWKREVLETIGIDQVKSVGYAFQIELKLRAHRAGFRLREIPIQFHDRRWGQSKMSGEIVKEAAFRVLTLRFHVPSATRRITPGSASPSSGAR